RAAYARRYSQDQKDDLERQKQVLELYCARQGWTLEVIADLRSGINYHKKGLKKLLEAIIDGQVGRLVITHKDRLLRLGAELVFAICEAKTRRSRRTWRRMFWRSSPCSAPGCTAAARARIRSCWTA